MMTVAQVEMEVREECKGQSALQLAKVLNGMGQSTEGLTRDQMVDKLVDLEVYAFTH